SLYSERQPRSRQRGQLAPRTKRYNLSRHATLLAKNRRAFNPATRRRHVEAAGHRESEIIRGEKPASGTDAHSVCLSQHGIACGRRWSAGRQLQKSRSASVHGREASPRVPLSSPVPSARLTLPPNG